MVKGVKEKKWRWERKEGKKEKEKKCSVVKESDKGSKSEGKETGRSGREEWDK